MAQILPPMPASVLAAIIDHLRKAQIYAAPIIQVKKRYNEVVDEFCKSSFSVCPHEKKLQKKWI